MESDLDFSPTIPQERGCGDRADGGLYLCVGTSPHGRPVEDFLIDPPLAWAGGVIRSPYLVPQIDGFGNAVYDGGRPVMDVFMWTGAQYYPFVPDFVEETRNLGVSKRIPKGFPTGNLTPGQSRMVLIHPKAKPRFEYDLRRTLCRLDGDDRHGCHGDADEHCVHALWDLSTLDTIPGKHDIDLGPPLSIRTPSATYNPYFPHWPDGPEELPYAPGIFAAFVLTHLEYVTETGDVDPIVIRNAGDGIPVVPMPK